MWKIGQMGTNERDVTQRTLHSTEAHIIVKDASIRSTGIIISLNSPGGAKRPV